MTKSCQLYNFKTVQDIVMKLHTNTPQPLYNTIVGVPDNFRVSYSNHVISRVNCIGYIGKEVLNSLSESKPDPCYIQNRVIMNCIIKRFWCLNQH